ncbi:hypothetical protein SETIT_5G105000v2 [Setaria italica]|uniref:Uncharacterized protein n=1 Tax=Setaria italica TaxID=4555 RepID=A0A368R3A9_SETIT|nr:hypothetical protein SETIT_5G105000v2 [Setaria italica]
MEAAGGVQFGSSKLQIVTQVEMAEARFYLRWKCEPERHACEKCQYKLIMERMLQMQKIREE